MALASPVLQCESLDSFPVSSDDFESAVMLCLCMAGMILMFARLVRLILILLLEVARLRAPSVLSATLRIDNRIEAPMFISFLDPLRI
jgi:hypothetical protein